MNATAAPASTSAKAFIWQYILPSICFMGILTNVVNVVMFSNRRRFSNSIYKYMLAHSVSNLAYVFFSFVYFFGANKVYQQNSYLNRLLEFYLLRSFTTCMAIFMIFIELHVAVKRLLIVTNYRKLPVPKIKISIVIILYLALSFATQLPFIMSNEILATGNQSYEIVVNSFGRTPPSHLAQMMFFLFRGIAAPIFLLVINMIMLLRYKKYINKKLNLQAIIDNRVESSLLEKSPDSATPLPVNHLQYRQHLVKMNKNLTLMVVAIGFLFLSCNLILSVTGLIFKFFPNRPRLYEFLSILTNVFLYSAHSLNIIIYYYFDRQYRAALAGVFSRVCAKSSCKSPITKV